MNANVKAQMSTQEVIKVRYTAKTHTSGGRRGGVSRSDELLPSSLFVRLNGTLSNF